MIDNFTKIKELLTFKEGTFYVFVALQRAKDFSEVDRTTMPLLHQNKQRLLKYWLVDNLETLDKYTQEMQAYCKAFNGRLYMCTDLKSNKKALVLLNKKVQDNLITRVFGASTPLKLFTPAMPLSVLEAAECSEKDHKYWLVDVDTKNEELLNFLITATNPKLVLDTCNGYHLLVKKDISLENLRHNVYHMLCGTERALIEIKDNALTLVYVA